MPIASALGQTATFDGKNWISANIDATVFGWIEDQTVDTANQIILVEDGVEETFDVGTTEASRRAAWEAFVTSANAKTSSFEYTLPPNVTFKVNDSTLTFSDSIGNFNNSSFINNADTSSNLLRFEGSRNKVSNLKISTSGTGAGQGRAIVNNGTYSEFSKVIVNGTVAGSGFTFHEGATADGNVYRQCSFFNQGGPFRLDGRGTTIDSCLFYNHSNNQNCVSANSTRANADFTITNCIFVVENQVAGFDRGFINFNTNTNLDQRNGTIRITYNKFYMLTPTNSVQTALLKCSSTKHLVYGGNEWNLGPQTNPIDTLRITKNTVSGTNWSGPYTIDKLTIFDEPIVSRISAENLSVQEIEIRNSNFDLTNAIHVRCFDSMSAERVTLEDVTFDLKTSDTIFLFGNSPKITMERCKINGNNTLVYGHNVVLEHLVHIETKRNQGSNTGQRWFNSDRINQLFDFKLDGTTNIYRWEPGLMSLSPTEPPVASIGKDFTDGTVTYNLLDPTGPSYYWTGGVGGNWQKIVDVSDKTWWDATGTGQTQLNAWGTDPTTQDGDWYWHREPTNPAIDQEGFYRQEAGTPVWRSNLVESIGTGPGGGSVLPPIEMQLTSSNLAQGPPQVVTLPFTVTGATNTMLIRSNGNVAVSSFYSITSNQLTWTPPDDNPLFEGEVIELKFLG